jgi:hypothetical protein
MERKGYGLELFRRGLAPRLILSVGRFEISRLHQIGITEASAMQEAARHLPPGQRHFFLDFRGQAPEPARPAILCTGTRAELRALAEYLQPAQPRSITIVSTSIHLRRVRLCCQRIPFYRQRNVRYAAVPEELSSFRCSGWWKRADHWRYVLLEWAKLGVYALSRGPWLGTVDGRNRL